MSRLAVAISQPLNRKLKVVKGYKSDSEFALVTERGDELTIDQSDLSPRSLTQGFRKPASRNSVRGRRVP